MNSIILIAALSLSPAQTLNEIHALNRSEIQMAALARQKSEDPKIRAFADQMMRDHEEADRRVVSLAKSERVPLREQASPQEVTAQVDRMTQMEGKEFDQEYLDANERTQEKTADLLKRAQKSLKDPEVKSFVQELIPKIERHQELAKNVLASSP